MAVDVTEALAGCVDDLEAAVYRLNGPGEGEKSPDRRVPGLALPSKGKTRNWVGSATETNYEIPRMLPPDPMGGLTGDVMVTLHGGKAATRTKPT
jgi:hypothetical protein